jgi:hypothetical protein
MNCRECEELLVDALYEELGGGETGEFEAHIGSCPVCADTYNRMRATLSAMDSRERPDPGQAYWDGFHNRLTARLEREEEIRRSRSWLGRLLPGLSDSGLRWAYRGVLAVVLVVFGAVAGRMILPGPGTDVSPMIGPVAESPVTENTVELAATPEACARQYIEDSKVLLLALVNFDMETESEYMADWAPQKKRSHELLVQASGLKEELNDPKQRRLRELVTELEMILIQIVNLETTGDLESVDLIRNTVSDKEVLLKINLEKMRTGDKDLPKPGACDA